MAGPWEKYQSQNTSKPWEKFQQDQEGERAPAVITTAPGAFGRSVNISGVKPEDLEAIKQSMINNAPTIGATIGEIAAGPPGLYGGAALGSAIKQSQNPPQSVSEGAKNLAEDVGLNAVVPQVAGKVIRSGLKTLGPKVYQSAFGKLNEFSRQKGKMPVGEVLFKQGLTGTDKKIGQEAVNLLPQYDAVRNDILSQIDAQGIKGDLKQAVQGGVDYANGLVKSRIPEEQAVGKQLLEDINFKYSSLYGSPETLTSSAVSSPTAAEMQKLKSLAGQGLSPAQWDKLNPASRGSFTKGEKIVGGGLKNELENMASQVSPETATQLQTNNAEQAALITAAKKLNANALKSYNKHLVTPVDAMTYALGHITDESGKTSGGTAALALKKAADLYKTTYGRTNLGMGMYDLGTTQAPIIETGIRAYSPWLGVNKKHNKEDEQ